MNYKKWILVVLASVIIAGCRGADETDISNPQFPVTNDPDAFDAFLNQSPAVPREGAIAGEIDNVQDFPQAYYNTIDPDGTRNTFRKWRFENGFINADGSDAACDPANCLQTHVTFRDTKDLGYGRNMFMRWNPQTKDVAVYVENFQVDAVPGVPYGPLNFEALVAGDRTWNFGVNAIEFSSYPDVLGDGRQFTKFYNFAGDGIRATVASGSQQHFVDLDNRGDKPMPTACIVCHGGRGRTLVYELAPGVKKLAPTLVGGIPGDVMAQMQTIEFDTLQFASEPGFTRADNEQGIQLINRAILDTYKQRAIQFTGDGDWSAQQAIDILEGRYAGDPANPANRYNANFVLPAWQADQDLYRSLVGPNCLVCHALRGTNSNRSVAFPTLNGFTNYKDRIDHLVFEQGKMPLGLLNYSNFWDSDDKDPATLANALTLPQRVGSDQKAIRPGAPVAVISAPPVATGIDAATGAGFNIAVTGSGSAFATPGGHRWSVDPAASAVIQPNGPQGDAVLTVSSAGTYTLTLSVDGVHGGTDSTTQTVRVVSTNDVVDARLPGESVQFFGAGGIEQLLTSVSAGCTDCHATDRLTSMPIHYEPCSSDIVNGNEFFYRSVLARVNFDSPLDSLILRKPSNGATDPVNRNTTQVNGYHNGGFALSSDADYGLIMSWILNGAPSGSIPAAATIPAGVSACIP